MSVYDAAKTPDTSNSSVHSAVFSVLPIAAGLTAACSYYNQAMLGRISNEFGTGASVIVLIPALTQLGNALGVLLIAPIGDGVERKKLLVTTVWSLVLALCMASLAPSFLWLAVASFFIGLAASAPQQLVPLSVQLAHPLARGKVTGVMLSGILIGLLFSRAISGFVADLWHWRAMFLIAAASVAAIGLVLRWSLPRCEPVSRIGYTQLIGSLRFQLKLHPTLLRISCAQALLFASLLGFWSTMPLAVFEDSANMTSAGVGAIGFAGIGGVLAALYAGRCADRYGAGRVSLAGLTIVLCSFAFLALTGPSIWALIFGLLFLDAGVQSSHAANQSRICALDALARNRLNTIFMASVLLGGSCGAVLGGIIFVWFGWSGVCGFGIAATCLSFLLLPETRSSAWATFLRVPAKG